MRVALGAQRGGDNLGELRLGWFHDRMIAPRLRLIQGATWPFGVGLATRMIRRRLSGSDHYKHFVGYLREHLVSEPSFTDKQKQQIRDDLDVVGDPKADGHSEEPSTTGLADRVCRWAHAHPADPIPHEPIPDLER